MADPAIRQAVLDEQLRRLTCEALPLGVDTLLAIMRSSIARDADKIQAVKAVETLRKSLEGSIAAMTGGKSLHDMEPAALMQLASQLQAKADAIDAEPVPEGGVFD
jgi:hypothetical protein